MASIMGAHRVPVADLDADEPGDGFWTPPERNLVAERLAYARGEGPKPEPDIPTGPLRTPTILG